MAYCISSLPKSLNVNSTTSRFLCIGLLLFSIFAFSCTSPKQILYFQDIDLNRIDTVAFTQQHSLAYGDIIEISVTSLESEDYIHFTRSGFRFSQDHAMQNAYVVDSTGIIQLPYLGDMNIKGLTTMEIRERLKLALQPFLKDPTVNVRVMNLKVSILGEVARPGTFNIPDTKISLPEALSLAGDLTINAKRNNVLIIREENGKRSYAKLDLRKSEVLGSPYYYLKPNDVVYVEPSRTRIASTDTRRWQLFTFITTSISLATILATRL